MKPAVLDRLAVLGNQDGQPARALEFGGDRHDGDGERGREQRPWGAQDQAPETDGNQHQQRVDVQLVALQLGHQHIVDQEDPDPQRHQDQRRARDIVELGQRHQRREDRAGEGADDRHEGGQEHQEGDEQRRLQPHHRHQPESDHRDQQGLEGLQPDILLDREADRGEHPIGLLAVVLGVVEAVDLGREGGARGHREAQVDHHQRGVDQGGARGGEGPPQGLRGIDAGEQVLQGHRRLAQHRHDVGQHIVHPRPDPGQLAGEGRALEDEQSDDAAEPGQDQHGREGGPGPVRDARKALGETARHGVDQQQEEGRHHQRREDVLKHPHQGAGHHHGQEDHRRPHGGQAPRPGQVGARASTRPGRRVLFV
jgi:hypothetical protein